MDATKVSTSKPNVGGAVYRAPLGTTLPADATTALGSSFTPLGYVSEDGITNSNTITTQDIKAFGGAIVDSAQTEKTDSFAFTLIEALNVDVLKTVYGESNVSVAAQTGLITVKANAAEMAHYVWVFEVIVKGGEVKRIVLPDAKISEIGDIAYRDNEAIAYPLTLKAFPDSATGNQTHYEYISHTTTSGSGG